MENIILVPSKCTHVYSDNINFDMNDFISGNNTNENCSHDNPSYVGYSDKNKCKCVFECALKSRKTKHSENVYNTTCTLSFSEWQKTSTFSVYTYFVQNLGLHTAIAFIQISPDKCAIVSEQSKIHIEPKSTVAIVAQKYGFFSRLAFKSDLPGLNTNIKIWFQGQV